MTDIDLQIEEIESARQELKKHFGEHYELSALKHTISFLEELKAYKGGVDYYAKMFNEYRKEHDAKIRADAIEEIQSKMISFHTDMIFEYGVDTIEARADAFGKLKDWLKEQKQIE